MNHCIAVGDFSRELLDQILSAARTCAAQPKSQIFQGQILATCFFEPSTRTRLSFESAMLQGGGSVIGFADSATTSSQKGESLSDTIRVISSYCDILAIRHPKEGSVHIAANASSKPVINAGDGSREHPTQTLIDLYSILQCQHTIDSLRIAIAGDLKFGRAAHSLCLALTNYRVSLDFISPPSLSLPEEIEQTLTIKKIPFTIHSSLDSALPTADILYMTRIQKERFQEGHEEKTDSYRLLKRHLALVKPNFKILHPLPRVDEIDTAIDATPFAYYFEQAAHGVAVRTALMALLLGKQIAPEFPSALESL